MSVGVGDHGGRAALLHPARVRGLVVARWRAGTGQHRRDAVLGELEDRAAGAGDREVGGRERLAERDQVVAQVVVRAGRGQVGEVAPAGDVEDAVGRVGERGDRRVVDRAGAERAAEDEHAALVGRRCRARRAPRSRSATRGGTGRPVTQIALAVAAGDREREADARGAGGEQAVAQAHVRVGLREDERDPPRDRGRADRAGDVAAAAEHRVRAPVAQDRAGRRCSASAALPTARAAFSGLLREIPSTRIGSSG